jgi:hypothetical protein
MVNVLYYDCFSGISGDMNLGALIDLGVERGFLLEELQKLDMGPYEIRITQDARRGISGVRVEVVLPPEGQISHKEGHAQERTFADIEALICASGLSDRVKDLSLKIFTKIAQAEAKVHGHTTGEVHFHEVGAVDSLVDMVGAAICLEYLQIERIYSSPVEMGGGFVRCAHGILPVPAPATAEILRGIPVKTGLVPFETTTPTGAAILAATVDLFTEEVNFIPLKIGYGIGSRDTDVPNVLRVFLGRQPQEAVSDDVERQEAVLLECNMDDMNPEQYECLMDLLFERGALDVFLTSIIMKKSRPAVKVSILCNAGQRTAMEEVLWVHSTTFGLRAHKVWKTMLKRDMATVKTKYGDIAVKNAYLRGRRIRSKPEYEDCKKLARERGVSLQEICDSMQSGDAE